MPEGCPYEGTAECPGDACMYYHDPCYYDLFEEDDNDGMDCPDCKIHGAADFVAHLKAVE